MNQYILPFAKVTREYLNIAGGKGANLGEMTGADFPVPPGFVVTTKAFDAFMAGWTDQNSLLEQLDHIASSNLDQARSLSAQLRKELGALSVPPEVAKKIEDNLKEFSSETAFAVRSSATAEDLPGASFAGQQDTYLNIKGGASVIDHVKKCWISLFTDRAVIYRLEKGFSHREVKLAAVVQKMVFPESSGILFTADPLSGHRNRIVIDAGYGLGEALVSGLINPDHYSLRKEDLQILKVDIGDKSLQIRPDGEGGTYEENLSAEKRVSQVLTREEITRLAQLGRKIEAHYQSPQDIEWCIEKGEIYIVQARPITSLYPIPQLTYQDDAYHAYVSLGHIQVMTDPMPPMAHSAIHKVFPFGKKGGAESNCSVFASSGSRLFIDFTPLLFHPILGRIIPKRLESLELLIAKSIQNLVEGEDFKRARRSGKGVKLSSILEYVKPVMQQTIKTYFFLPYEGRTSERLDFYLKWFKGVEEKVNQSPDSGERLFLIRQEMLGFFKVLMTIIGYMIPGFIAKSRILKMVRSQGLQNLVAALESGLKGNVTTEMDLELGDLTDEIRKIPGLLELLQGSSHMSETLRKLNEDPGYGEFLKKWYRFMDRYGMRGISEFDISKPRWSDDPTSLLMAVKGMMQGEVSGHHRKQYGELTAEAERSGQILIKAVDRGLFRKRKVQKMTRLIGLMRNGIPLREHGKYFLMRIFGLLREELVKAAVELKSTGRIHNIEDVWFLNLDEVIKAFSEPEMELKDRISLRRAGFEADSQKVPPRVIASTGEIPKAVITGDFPKGAIPGAGVSSGQIEGIARVITDPMSQVLEPGEILVAPFTDPAWTPLFINASAVVIEVGGMMTHGSVIAREYGIPAVVSVIDATTLIETGQRIRVNGDLGYVEVLEQ